jgi:hypothetical protein
MENDTIEIINSLREKVARLEERLDSSNKALTLARDSAEKAIEIARNKEGSNIVNFIAIISIFISLITFTIQFVRK